MDVVASIAGRGPLPPGGRTTARDSYLSSSIFRLLSNSSAFIVQK
jgi:hypothetical protein